MNNSDKITSKKSKHELKKKPWYREYLEALIVAGILALVIRTFVVQAFKIPSGSMENTLLIGDHLLVNKFIYGTHLPFTDRFFFPLRSPERGDVIVFEFPQDAGKSYFDRRDFIKRVIGEPGDVIEVRNKRVFVNGKVFRLPQEIHKENETIPPEVAPRDFLKPIKVPEEMFFVMGDNRDRSFDSRFWGFVDRKKIKGLAFIKYWSWNRQDHWPRWGRIGRPIY